MAKPVLFVGSSTEALAIAAAIEVNLRHSFTVKLWTAGVFEPSRYPLESLEGQLGETTFGIFVFSRDDVLNFRRADYAVTRDNVVFELGLFMGALGRQNCFIIMPTERTDMHIPSDLTGFTPAVYDAEVAETDPLTALHPACSEILLSINKRLKKASPPHVLPTAKPVTLVDPALARHMADLLDMISRGQAGVEVADGDLSRREVWWRTALKMALASLRALDPNRPEDLYTIWLRPSGGALDSLRPFEAANLGADYDTHYEFRLGEGLAGTVWAIGQAAVHSPSNPDPRWKIRHGCDNESYIAVVVGEPMGTGGVLAAGSDSGFEPSADDIEILKGYAAVLALTV